MMSAAACNGDVTGDDIGSEMALACRFASTFFSVSGVGTDMRVSVGVVVVSVAGAEDDVCTFIGGPPGATSAPPVFVYIVVPRGAGLVYTVESV